MGARGYILNLVILLLLMGGLASAASPEGIPGRKEKPSHAFTFSVIPYYSPEKIWKLFTPFAEYLSKSTGHPWELRLFHNHAEFIDGLCSGQISVALVGPAPLSIAHDRCGVRPLLVALSQNGEPRYHSLLVTSDPAIRSMADLRGRKVGFFRGSTAAHIVPVRMLKEGGLRLSDIRPLFLESQDRIMTALLSGEIAAGAMKESLYARFSSENLRIVARSAPLPNFALCASPSLPPRVAERLVSILLRLKPRHNPRDAQTVREWDDEIRNGFVQPPAGFLTSLSTFRALLKDNANELR